MAAASGKGDGAKKQTRRHSLLGTLTSRPPLFLPRHQKNSSSSDAGETNLISAAVIHTAPLPAIASSSTTSPATSMSLPPPTTVFTPNPFIQRPTNDEITPRVVSMGGETSFFVGGRRGRGSNRGSSAVDSDSLPGAESKLKGGQSSARSDSVPFSWSESPLEEDNMTRQSFTSLGTLWQDPDAAADHSRGEVEDGKGPKKSGSTPPQSPRRRHVTNSSPSSLKKSSDFVDPDKTRQLKFELDTQQQAEAPGEEPPGSAPHKRLESISLKTVLPESSQTSSCNSPTTATPVIVHLSPRTSVETMEDSNEPLLQIEVVSPSPVPKKRKQSLLRRLTSLGLVSEPHSSYNRRASADCKDTSLSAEAHMTNHSAGPAGSSPRMPHQRFLMSIAGMLVGSKVSPRTAPPTGSHRSRGEELFGETSFPGRGSTEICLPSPDRHRRKRSNQTSASTPPPTRHVSPSSPTTSCNTNSSPVTTEIQLGENPPASPPRWGQGRHASNPTPQRRPSWKDDEPGLAKRRASNGDVVIADVLAPIRESGTSTVPASKVSDVDNVWPIGQYRRYLKTHNALSAKLSPQVMESPEFIHSLEHHFGKRNAVCRFNATIRSVTVWSALNMKGIFCFGPLISTSSAMTSQQIMPLYFHLALLDIFRKAESDLWSSHLYHSLPLPYENSHKALLLSFNQKSYSQQEMDALITLYGMLNSQSCAPKLFCAYDDNVSTHLVFEFLEGVTLTEHVELQQPFPPRTVKAWLEELLQLLDFLHSNGLTVRNLRPDSLIIMERREPLAPQSSSGRQTSLVSQDYDDDTTSSTEGNHEHSSREDNSSVNLSRVTHISRVTQRYRIAQSQQSMFSRSRHTSRLCLVDLSALCHFNDTALLPPPQPHVDFCAPEMLIPSEPPFSYGAGVDLFALGQIASFMMYGKVLLKSGVSNLKRRSAVCVFNSEGHLNYPSKGWRVGLCHLLRPLDPPLREDEEGVDEAPVSVDEQVPARSVRLPREWYPNECVAYELPVHDDVKTELKGWRKTEFFNLLCHMVAVDPRVRITAKEALKDLSLVPDEVTPMSSRASSVTLSLSHGSPRPLESQVAYSVVSPENIKPSLIKQMLNPSAVTSKLSRRLLDETRNFSGSSRGSPQVVEEHKSEEAQSPTEHVIDTGSQQSAEQVNVSSRRPAVSSVDTLLAEIEADGSREVSELEENRTIGTSLVSPSTSGPEVLDESPPPLTRGTSASKSNLKRSTTAATAPQQNHSPISRTRRGSQLFTVVANSFKNLFGDSNTNLSPHAESDQAHPPPQRGGTFERARLSRRHSLATPATHTKVMTDKESNAVAQLAEFLETRKRMKVAAAQLAAHLAQSESSGDEEQHSAFHEVVRPPSGINRTVSPTPVSSSTTDSPRQMSPPSPDPPLTLLVKSSSPPKSPSRATINMDSRHSSRGNDSTLSIKRPAVRPELFVPSPERWANRRASCAAMIQPVPMGEIEQAGAVAKRGLWAKPSSETRRPMLSRAMEAHLPPPLPRQQQLSVGWHAKPLRSQHRLTSQEQAGLHSMLTSPKRDKSIGPVISMMDEDTQTYEMMLSEAACQTEDARIDKVHKGTQTDEPIMTEVGCDQNDSSWGQSSLRFAMGSDPPV
eukprot:Blabericola_migrator_1__8727@NODE_45_length_16846_cov_82_345015_g41_i0_p1_GENE_NODE_45_length_16846_cov_82_345015_g41_i0NODE_45_length_16846_cov_82_345015_g41_i0_p1_ORF_typecomplete_len1617_score278_30Pkinase/PF00069_25/4_5e20Pkinase_Tyr/PF07714_17/0_0034Kdo/PF06293_14/0_16_NODE_45_length_16846_cov_82_345015_g41_i01198116831